MIPSKVSGEATDPGDDLPVCGMCGCRMVTIRGRYPGEDNRVVCPTCLADRMARIHDESGSANREGSDDE